MCQVHFMYISIIPNSLQLLSDSFCLFFTVREINIDSIQAPEPRTRDEFLQCEFISHISCLFSLFQVYVLICFSLSLSFRCLWFDPGSKHGPSASGLVWCRHRGHPSADVSAVPRPPSALRRLDAGALSPAPLLRALLLGGGVEGAWLLSGCGQWFHVPQRGRFRGGAWV